MPDRLQISLDGTFAVLHPDGTAAPGLSRRAQGLLAYLACQPRMRAERAFLADLLWSDRGEEQARASLRQELSVLRRALPEGTLAADRQCVSLDPARIVVTGARGGPDFLQGFDLPSEGFEDWLRHQRQAAASPAASPTTPDDPPPRGARPSLAVLPFTELGAPEADMFADGVVEEITGALSRVRDFHVIARQSAFALRGKALPAPEIARLLTADYLVEGSVRRSGDRVRISVKLVNGADGRTIWSDRCDDRLDDLFDLQDRVAARVAGQISPNLRAAEIDRARRRSAPDRTGYGLVMSAMPHFWAHRPDDNATALGLFDRAIAADPGHPLPRALKAWCMAQRLTYLWSADPAAEKAAALALANQAANTARDHVLTLVAVGAAISMTSDDSDRASAFIDQALAIDPNNAWGWMRRGYILAWSGQPRQGRRAFDKAIELSPLDPYLHNMVIGQGVAEMQAGNLPEAKALIEKGMALGPNVKWALRPLVALCTIMGHEDEAMRAARAFRAAYPHVTIAYMRASLPSGFITHDPAHLDAMRRAGVPES